MRLMLYEAHFVEKNTSLRKKVVFVISEKSLKKENLSTAVCSTFL